MREAGVLLDQVAAEMIADRVHGAVTQDGPRQTRGERRPGLELSQRAGHPGADNRHFFGDRKAAPGQHQEQDDSEIMKNFHYSTMVSPRPTKGCILSGWGPAVEGQKRPRWLRLGGGKGAYS